MRELAYYEAKLEALSELMAADESVHLIGGSFLGLSPHRGLFSAIEKNYPDRVIAPPISELGYCGLAIGAAMAGLRPVVDLGTGSFIYDSAENPPIKPVRHSEQSEESRVFQDLRPFTSFRVTFRGHSSAESLNELPRSKLTG